MLFSVDRDVAFCYVISVMQITIIDSALKNLDRIPPKTRDWIVATIEQYATDPDSLAANVKRLKKARKGEMRFLRLRVGDWRVIVSVTGDEMVVTRVAPRGRAYD